MVAQIQTRRQSPLSQYDRQIIAAAANKAEDVVGITAADIWTIRTDRETGVAWIHLYDGRQLPFNTEQFRNAIAEAKAELAAKPVRDSSKKVAREIVKGDRLKIEKKIWTVTDISSFRTGAMNLRSQIYAIKLNLVIFDGCETKKLSPYSEVIFDMA